MTGLNNQYQQLIDDTITRLSDEYNAGFTPRFDPSMGVVVAIDNNNQSRFPIYPVNNTSTAFPNTGIEQGTVIAPAAVPAGTGILRVEHVGLPTGYYPTTQINGLLGLSPITNVFSTLDRNALNTYPSYIRDNLIQDDGALNFIYPNQEVIQLEVPMGGTLQIGYNIRTNEFIDTPNGRYVQILPWSGVDANGSLYNLAPHQLYTVKIHWRLEDVPQPPIVPPVIPPTPIPTQSVPDIITAIGSVAPSVFIPSPTILPQLPPLRNSFVELTSPYVDPTDTFRAETINQLYSFSPIARSFRWVYDIGRPPAFTPIEYKFRNNTTNTTIQIDFNIPSWVKSSVGRRLILTAGSESTIQFIFDENDAKSKSFNSQKLFIEELTWSVTALNVVGPVFVKRNLPPLVTVNTPPPEQTPDTGLPFIPITLQNGNTILPPYKAGFEILPQNVSVVVGNRTPLKLSSMVGELNSTLDFVNSLQAIFPLNGVRWYTNNPSVAVIESPNGNNNATFVPLAQGTALVSAEVVAFPSNISSRTWIEGVEQIGGKFVESTRLPNGQFTIKVSTLIRVVEKQTQLR